MATNQRIEHQFDPSLSATFPNTLDAIVVISHLRWDFVWQRPQHLLSRLAKSVRVIFVEEPITGVKDATASLDVSPAFNSAYPISENVTVIRLRQPGYQGWIGHGDRRTQATYNRLLREYLKREGVENPLLWLYTPMAGDFIDAIPHGLLAFDVMDQLSAFNFAPAELVQREKRILASADIVFTGGLSLYESKQAANPNTHLFPSGVDIAHFAKAAAPSSLDRPVDLKIIRTKPDGLILGYFGVIDERIDLGLIEALADARPDWQIAMIGPVTKIDSKALPRRANIHWLGGRPYSELPAYLAAFDVALMPFALNEATRYISPTKTLEYLAAHKPVVSTPIRDVIACYGEVVQIADDAEGFVAAIEEAMTDRWLAESNPTTVEVLDRRERENAILEVNTWDAIVARMTGLIARAANR